MSLLTILLQSDPGAFNLVFFALLFAIMYFFFFRPQMKRQKEQGKFSSGIEKGDEIVTGSGIYGRVNKIEGDIITVQVDTKTFLRIARSAISKEMTEAAATAATKNDDTEKS